MSTQTLHAAGARGAALSDAELLPLVARDRVTGH